MTSALARIHALGPWRATLGLTLAVAALHLLVAGRAPLTADEAHYALYGLNLDWSYFDHPPMVGWLQALVLPLSQGEFALRLWPILLSALTALVLYSYSRRLFPQESPWIAFTAVALFESGLLFQALGLALIPETPLLLFALLAMLALLRALEHDAWSAWLWFGLCIGLAGLSKYTSVTLVVTAVLFVLLQRRSEVLHMPKLWMALLLSACIALIFISPVLYWNAEHDWISFRYQLGHGFRPKDWAWWRVGVSQLAQVLAYSPGIYVFGLIALIAGFRRWREPGTQLTLLLVIPVFLLFLSGSGREETLPHWTALAWAGTLPLAARWLHAQWAHRWVRSVTYASTGYSLVLLVLVYIVLLLPSLPIPGKHHPLSPVLGWPEAAARATALRAEFSLQEPDAVLLVPNWSLASRLAWYARPQPVQVTDERFDQFDLWFGSPRPGSDGVLVVPDTMHRRSQKIVERFEACREAEPHRVVRGGQPVVTFHFYLCRDYRGLDNTPHP